MLCVSVHPRWNSAVNVCLFKSVFAAHTNPVFYTQIFSKNLKWRKKTLCVCLCANCNQHHVNHNGFPKYSISPSLWPSRHHSNVWIHSLISHMCESVDSFNLHKIHTGRIPQWTVFFVGPFCHSYIHSLYASSLENSFRFDLMWEMEEKRE